MDYRFCNSIISWGSTSTVDFFAPFLQLRNWIFRSFELRLNVTICQFMLKKITNKWFSSKQFIVLPFCISCIYFKYAWQVLLTKFISQWVFFEVVHDIFFYVYTMSHKCHNHQRYVCMICICLFHMGLSLSLIYCIRN